MAAQDHTNTSDIMANSQSLRDLSLPGFNPDQEALASTRRDGTPRKEGLSTVLELTEDLDYQIDTSIMEKNLPHFSSAEDEDADDDMSLEVGRGSKPFSKIDDSRDAMMSFDGSQADFSPVVKSRSPLSVQLKPSRKSASSKENLRKDAAIRRASLANKDKETPVKNKASRPPHKSPRRSQGDVLDKIRETIYDRQYSSDDHTGTRNSKNTRFNKVRLVDQSNKIDDAVARAAGRSYPPIANGVSKDQRMNGNNTNTITDTQTRQSFALPDTENLSELVSGVIDHGSRQSMKPRATRFAPPTTTEAQQYASLEAVPIPTDEKMLFASYRHLQGQLSSLKADNEQLREEVREFKMNGRSGAPQEEERKPTYASSDDNGYSQRPAKAAIENNRLQAANITLQEHLEQAINKITSLEAALKQAEKEKDTALSQRGAAYFASRELKLRNEELVKENEELHARVDLLAELLKAGGAKSNYQAPEKASRPEASGRNQEPTMSEIDSIVHDRRTYLEDEAAAERHAQRVKEANARPTTKSRPVVPVHGDSQEFAELFSLDIPFREQRSRAERNRPRPSDGQKPKKSSGGAKHHAQRTTVQDEDKEDIKPAGYYARRMADGTQRDFTYMRFVDAEEIARLRKTIEEERLQQQKRLLQRDPTLTEAMKNPTLTHGLKPALKRKKSDVSRAGVSVDGTAQLTVQSETTEQLNAGNNADANAEDADGGPANEQTKASVAPNDNTTKIPRPIPVSERMPERMPENGPSGGGDDPTERPAQDPAVALAAVIKNLEDEVEDRKGELDKNENALRAQDASMGKRRRKLLVQMIESLLHEIDTKSDQIYALYDVLEGLKAAGAEMSQDEVEITIRDIIGQGTRVNKGKARATEAEAQADDDDFHEYVEESVEEWNGFESSGDVARSVSRRKNSRVSL